MAKLKCLDNWLKCQDLKGGRPMLKTLALEIKRLVVEQHKKAENRGRGYIYTFD